MTPVFLNIDAGELERENLALYTSAHALNIACGGHAGDRELMDRALHACRQVGIQAGAHPSYPDRAGFGRHRMDLQLEVLQDEVRAQCHALQQRALRAEVPLRHLKLHGALYHAANDDPGIAAACLDGALGALGPHIQVLGPESGHWRRACAARSLPYCVEGFADRARRADGTLVPRSEAGAVHTTVDACVAQALELLREGRVQTLCVHGDTDGAADIAKAIRRLLERADLAALLAARSH